MIVHTPATLEEVCQLAQQHPEAQPMAGATDIFVHWPQRQSRHDKTYIDLSGVASLKHISFTTDALTIGATATYWETLNHPQVIAEFPLLCEAARQVGAVQIQSRGTWAGNIANGSPAADGVPALMARDAAVSLVSSAGARVVPLAAFYTGYRANVMRPGEIIGAITVPRRRSDFHAFLKVGPRAAQSITKVGVVLTRFADGSPDPWRVVAVSVAPTVRRCPAIERLLNDRTPLNSPADLYAAATKDITPIDDIRSTADYRREVFCRVLFQAVRG